MGVKAWAVALTAVLSCAAAIAPVGLAGQPTITRETIDETFPDDFLSDVCGVAVESNATGQLTSRSFEAGGRLIEVFTVNVSIVSTSEFGTFRFKDVGADITRETKDGVVHQIIGQLPFWFNGTAWENPITGEILKEPTGADLFESMVDDACAALAP